jgi:hypothetical protein
LFRVLLVVAVDPFSFVINKYPGFSYSYCSMYLVTILVAD